MSDRCLGAAPPWGKRNGIKNRERHAKESPLDARKSAAGFRFYSGLPVPTSFLFRAFFGGVMVVKRISRSPLGPFKTRLFLYWPASKYAEWRSVFYVVAGSTRKQSPHYGADGKALVLGSLCPRHFVIFYLCPPALAHDAGKPGAPVLLLHRVVVDLLNDCSHHVIFSFISMSNVVLKNPHIAVFT